MCGMSIFNSPLFLIADAIECDPLGVRGAAIDAHQFVDELAKTQAGANPKKSWAASLDAVLGGGSTKPSALEAYVTTPVALSAGVVGGAAGAILGFGIGLVGLPFAMVFGQGGNWLMGATEYAAAGIGAATASLASSALSTVSAVARLPSLALKSTCVAFNQGQLVTV